MPRGISGGDSVAEKEGVSAERRLHHTFPPLHPSYPFLPTFLLFVSPLLLRPLFVAMVVVLSCCPDSTKPLRPPAALDASAPWGKYIPSLSHFFSFSLPLFFLISVFTQPWKTSKRVSSRSRRFDQLVYFELLLFRVELTSESKRLRS